MFSTPLIWSSMGDTTVEATTSALAPGYCPVTLIIGGAISGYWATGRRENDTVPTITNTMEITAAKIGRSMKKCEMRIALPQSALSWEALGSALAWGEPGIGVGGASFWGLTFWFGRARINPLTMTRSSSCRPLLITRRLLNDCPSVTYFTWTTLSASTTKTYLRVCSVPIAASGTSEAL